MCWRFSLPRCVRVRVRARVRVRVSVRVRDKVRVRVSASVKVRVQDDLSTGVVARGFVFGVGVVGGFASEGFVVVAGALFSVVAGALFSAVADALFLVVADAFFSAVADALFSAVVGTPVINLIDLAPLILGVCVWRVKGWRKARRVCVNE